jgi:hypothetical protein
MRLGFGSHAGSHADEPPPHDPDPPGQPEKTSPRSRTGLNGTGRRYGNLRIRRLGVQVPRACPGQRPVSLGGADLVRCQLVRTFESPDTPQACRASWRSAIMTIWAMQRLPCGRRTLSSADCWKSISGLA